MTVVSATTPGQLKQSARPSEVVLISDSDMLSDHVSVREQEVMGHRLVSPINGNLNFVQSLVEEMSGDDNLITARSRANMDHPFTRVKEMQATAGKQWEAKAQALETQQRDMDQKIKELQARGGNNQGAILTPDQDQELAAYKESMAQMGHELKQVRENLRKDTEALEFRAKVINIGAMPCVVASFRAVPCHHPQPPQNAPENRATHSHSHLPNPRKNRGVQMNRKQFFLILMALIIVGSAGLILAHRNRDAQLLQAKPKLATRFSQIFISKISRPFM